jgi:plasmid stabilization system protein ParE
MAYRVELSPSALDDVDAIVHYISADSVENARRWRNRLFQKLFGIGVMPRGCSLAPEDECCTIEVRQFFFGRYRILFTIRDADSLVYVLTVRHGARRFLTGAEIDDIE